MEEMALLMKKAIKISDKKNGWFGKHLRCTEGKDIMDWVINHVERNQSRAELIC